MHQRVLCPCVFFLYMRVSAVGKFIHLFSYTAAASEVFSCLCVCRAKVGRIYGFEYNIAVLKFVRMLFVQQASIIRCK